MFPVLILMIMAIFQGVVFYQAKEHAQAAAAEGLRVARLYDGSADAGEQEARLLLSQTDGDWLLTSPTVVADRTGQWASVTVAGTAPTFVPFLTLDVSEVAEGPVERYVGVAEP